MNTKKILEICAKVAQIRETTAIAYAKELDTVYGSEEWENKMSPCILEQRIDKKVTSLPEYLGQGMHRYVFRMEKTKVLKIAKSKSGDRDNFQESLIRKTVPKELEKHFPEVYGFSSEYTWIVQKRYLPLSHPKIMQMIGNLSFHQVLKKYFPAEAIRYIQDDIAARNFGIDIFGSSVTMVCFDPCCSVI